MRKTLSVIVVVRRPGRDRGTGLLSLSQQHPAAIDDAPPRRRRCPTYPIAPLTGLPDPTGLSVKRPALTIKIENTPQALPQWGIDQADVVYEEIVNGGITRLGRDLQFARAR